MSTGYQIKDRIGYYFLTFQVIDWVDIFTRKAYRDIIIDSFDYCRRYKGLKIWAYVVMSNHVHCILSATNNNLPDIIRDFKRHTASKILYLCVGDKSIFLSFGFWLILNSKFIKNRIAVPNLSSFSMI